MAREKNRMTIEEARAYQELAGMDWQQWEQKFNGLLREGGWEWWQDRVIPLQEIRKKLYGFGLPPRVINGFMQWLASYLQKVGRVAGLPDRLIMRKFLPGDLVSPQLWTRVGGVGTLEIGSGRWRYLGQDAPDGSVVGMTVIGLVELKTGKATTTDKQQRWLDLINQCPGAFGDVARPHEIPHWRRMLIQPRAA